jgi:hypothetical protein
MFKKQDEDKIKINGEEFSKAQINVISKKVLENCHYLHKKNKNNMTYLKSGNGKLSQTSGMTLNDFISKYNL